MRRHAALLAAAIFLLAAILQPPFVGSAKSHTREVAAAALVAYAALRTINIAISVAKETEFSVPIVGAVGAKPGMALDPIDETVARISDAVFLVLSVTALLSLAFGPIATLGAVLAGCALGALWLAHRASFWPVRQASARLAMLGIVLALILPASFAVGGRLGKLATDSQLASACVDLLDVSGSSDASAVCAGADGDAGHGGTSGTAGLADPELPPVEALPWWNFWSGSDASAYEGDEEGWIRQWHQHAETILTSSITIIGVYVLRLLVFPALVGVVLTIIARQVLAGLVDGSQPPLRTT